MIDWINVQDKLPERPGYYLVHMIHYPHGCMLKDYYGVTFSRFHKNKTWSLENYYHEKCIGWWSEINDPTEYGNLKEDMKEE